MSNYKRLLKYIFNHKTKLIVALMCMLVASVTTLSLPWLVKVILANAIRGQNILQLHFTIFSALSLSFLLASSQYGQNYLMSYIGQKMIYTIRNEIFERLTLLSLKFYKDRHTGEIVSRAVNDVNVLQNFITSGVTNLIKEPIVLTGAIIIIFHLHWKLALLSLIVGPLIAFVIITFGKKMRKVSYRIQEMLAKVTTVLQEFISGVHIVKLFNQEDYENNRFKEENNRYFKIYLKGVKLTVVSPSMIQFLSNVGIVVVLWYGAYEVWNKHLSIENLIAFILYLTTMSQPIKNLSNINLSIQQVIAASERIFEIIDTSISIQENQDAIILPPVKGKIELIDISFAYEQTPVLESINLTINPGEVLAIVGPSGRGKTTLVNLIPRLYDPSSGEIRIDGYDIKKVTTASLRQYISVVPQEIILFSGTIEQNIAYGKNGATIDEVVQAANIANAHDFIINLPKGYDTEIGENGAKLSGGQRQRISIARAIIRQPKILILDEATSSLDSESENLIQAALSKIMHRQTTIVIAHRLSTIIKADRIVVIDKGRIVEQGTHQDLLKRQGVYHRLYENYEL